ncbi:MAG: glycosyltransferase [Mycobacterium sp.]
MQPSEVVLVPRSRAPWEALLGPERWEILEHTVQLGQLLFSDKAMWCVNSTADGGGVAEMLRTMLSYMQGAGMQARWAVIAGDPEFFAITKRIHNCIHGRPGDGGSLDAPERWVFERASAANFAGLKKLIEPGSVVMLHDPQTAALVRPLQRHGCTVLWRTHIGAEHANEYVNAAWSFIEPYVAEADGLVFSRWIYVPNVLANGPTAIVPPSIDPFAPKNQELDDETVRAVLRASGLLGGGHRGAAPVFRRLDGRLAEVTGRAVLFDGGPPAAPDRPIVLQVSRWDRLKDHLGVMQAFADKIADRTDAELMLVGPDDEFVADDPEASAVLNELCAAHAALPGPIRRRIHIASIPMADSDENAVIVNALQRHATVVVQKSIEEGFGLTVTEAMWKSRPLIASAVGGLREQVTKETGVLLRDPHDLDEFADTAIELLDDRERAQTLGDAGRQFVFDNFLHDRHFRQYVGLVARMAAASGSA